MKKLWTTLVLLFLASRTPVLVASELVYTPGMTGRVNVRPALGTLIRFPHPVSTMSALQGFRLSPVGTDYTTFEAKALRASNTKSEELTVLFQNGELMTLKLSSIKDADPFVSFRKGKSRSQKGPSAFADYTEALTLVAAGGLPSTFRDRHVPDDTRLRQSTDGPVSIRLVRHASDAKMTALVFRVRNRTDGEIHIRESDFSLGTPNLLRAGLLRKRHLSPCPVLGSKAACETTLWVIAKGGAIAPELISARKSGENENRRLP